MAEIRDNNPFKRTKSQAQKMVERERDIYGEDSERYRKAGAAYIEFDRGLTSFHEYVKLLRQEETEKGKDADTSS